MYFNSVPWAMSCSATTETYTCGPVAVSDLIFMPPPTPAVGAAALAVPPPSNWTRSRLQNKTSDGPSAETRLTATVFDDSRPSVSKRARLAEKSKRKLPGVSMTSSFLSRNFLATAAASANGPATAPSAADGSTAGAASFGGGASATGDVPGKPVPPSVHRLTCTLRLNSTSRTLEYPVEFRLSDFPLGGSFPVDRSR